MRMVISVVIPTFNRQELTNRAVDSIRCKLPELIEVIVVDDCGTQPYVHQNASNAHGVLVRVIRAESNKGPGVARSIGVEQAMGEFIAFLDSDDVFGGEWLDAVLFECLVAKRKPSEQLFIVGGVIGASLIVRIVESMLRVVPETLHLIFVRMIFMLSNAFHTPSIAISRDACFFSDSLRYCEDYYTNAMAIFQVSRFCRLNVTACELSRRQGTNGGESGAKWRMFKGEMHTRRMLLTSRTIPIFYRVLVPVGMVYQVVRVIAMVVFRILPSARSFKDTK